MLIEFQRTVDPWMAVRVMTYVGLLYQDLIRRGQMLEGQRLPPVLPIVLYNGDARWGAAKDVAELIPTPPGLVGQYVPHLSYLLIEENRYADEDLAKLKNLAAAMIRVEHAAAPEVLPQVVALIHELVSGNAELERTFAIWIGHHFDLDLKDPPVRIACLHSQHRTLAIKAVLLKVRIGQRDLHDR